MIVALSPSVERTINEMGGTADEKRVLGTCVRLYSTSGWLFGIVRRVVEAVLWIFSYWSQSVEFLKTKGSCTQEEAESRLWNLINENNCPQTKKTKSTVAVTLSSVQEPPVVSKTPKPKLKPSSRQNLAKDPESEISSREKDKDVDVKTLKKKPWKPTEFTQLSKEEKSEDGKPIKRLPLSADGHSARAALMTPKKTGKPLELPIHGDIQEVENEGVVREIVNEFEQHTTSTSTSVPQAQNSRTTQRPAQPPQSSQDLPA